MTPEQTIGRVVAAVVMLVSLALLTVVTATITSYFIQRSTRVSVQSNHDEITLALTELQASIRELSRQLDAVTRELNGTDETPTIDIQTFPTEAPPPVDRDGTAAPTPQRRIGWPSHTE